MNNGNSCLNGAEIQEVLWKIGDNPWASNFIQPFIQGDQATAILKVTLDDCGIFEGKMLEAFVHVPNAANDIVKIFSIIDVNNQATFVLPKELLWWPGDYNVHFMFADGDKINYSNILNAAYTINVNPALAGQNPPTILPGDKAEYEDLISRLSSQTTKAETQIPTLQTENAKADDLIPKLTDSNNQAQQSLTDLNEALNKVPGEIQKITEEGTKQIDLIIKQGDATLNDAKTLGGKTRAEFDNQINFIEKENLSMSNSKDSIAYYTKGSYNSILPSKRIVNIIGDSISYGLDSSDYFFKSYASIISRLFMADNKSANSGFQTLMFSSENEMQYHTNSGFSSLNGDGLVGWVRASGNIGDWLKITTKPFSTYTCIVYTKFSGGGKADVFKNGVDTGIDIDCSGNSNFNYIEFSNETNPETGKCELEIRPKGDGEVRVYGTLNYDNINAPCINNFSIGGRRFKDANESVINDIVRCDMLLFALNHNDRGDYDSNVPGYRAALDSNFNMLIQKANEANTKVVILDFCWGQELKDSLLRQKLVEVKNNIKGARIIQFPNLFKNNGEILTYSEKFNKYKMFLDDQSHPSAKGHEVIANAISNFLNFKSGNTYIESILKDQRYFNFSPNNKKIKNTSEWCHTSSAYKFEDFGVNFRLYFRDGSEWDGLNKRSGLEFFDGNNNMPNSHSELFGSDYSCVLSRIKHNKIDTFINVEIAGKKIKLSSYDESITSGEQLYLTLNNAIVPYKKNIYWDTFN